LAFTELWERFSFYGLQGILSFYLLFSLDRGGLELDVATAAGIVGAYGGAVYVAQLGGAWVGERLVCPRLMVLFGGMVIAVGHLVLAFWTGLGGLGIGLGLIIAGTGALKTNITSIVGMTLDGAGDAKRDAGFSYFLMAINIGAVVGPLSTGLAQNQLGFHYGFGLAAIGMFVALAQYVVTMKRLPQQASVVNNPLGRPARVKALVLVILAAVLLIGAVSMGLLPVSRLAVFVTTVAVLAAIWYFSLILSSKKVSRTEKTRVASFIPIFIAIGIYFGLLFQQFTSMSALITDRVDLQIFGWSFPVAWIITTSQLAAVLVTPSVARLWERLGTRQPGPATKVGIGMLQIGAAYVCLIVLSATSSTVTIPLVAILIVMIIAGSSEVLVNPVGMALASKIGPSMFRSQLMGLYFLTLALGSSISGLLGQLFAQVPELTYFIIVSAIGLAMGVVLIAFRSRIQQGLVAGLAKTY
jgi:POT family proton-dependent oligopeptide transporter